MIVTFLFWNLQKKPLRENVVRLAVQFAVDVIILAEYTLDTALLIGELSTQTHKQYCAPPSEARKLQILTSFQSTQIIDQFNDTIGGLTIRHMKVPGLPGILLAAAHFPSKMNWSEDDQNQQAVILARDIARTEELTGNSRTVLVGDLNMNPFEAGVVGAHALHAVMTKALADKRQRTVYGTNSNDFFYNPNVGVLWRPDTWSRWDLLFALFKTREPLLEYL